ncbi:MAG: bifunctional phosphopantothenoylcysteine decarboxylase/phosphopantothenate--cysteine ligase CoaBC [Candidatus Melainabacteria bacterium]|nr:bifunctional phosphopantothenoylcysteine decarboxylase/phosphopantothenate--cysteine ligase CoaBC [Candidatus Melainabacteria bacterium]
MRDPQSKNIILGISAGIAAYKMYDLVSELKRLGHNVKVVLTKDAKHFVSELPLKVLSSNPVYSKMFSPEIQSKPIHIELADNADLILVAPATADIIAKIANGISDELITSILLAARVPVYIAPAMNTKMWENFTVQKNIETLVTKLGYKIIPPEEGELTCGYSGIGHIATNEKIIKNILYEATKEKLLQGKRIIITAGGTREVIDPVRYIGNKSSGKMGLALADVAYNMGAEIILVTTFPCQRKYQVIEVESAHEMQEVIESEFDKSDALIMAAAVSDYRPITMSKSKIKKKNEDITIELTRNPDILEILGRTKQKNQVIIGFSAESENIEKNAQEKLHKKKIDMIVANDISIPDIGFGSDENAVTILTKDRQREVLQRQSKAQIARHICNKLVSMFEVMKEVKKI